MKAEWIINAAKEKIYAVSHAKAVFRGNSGNTVDNDLTKLETDVSSHTGKQVNTEAGAHNLRCYNGSLQYFNGTKWADVDNLRFHNGSLQYFDGAKWVDVSKEKFGLGNVDNTSDMNKPVSTPQKKYIDGSVSEFLTSEDAAVTLDESNPGIDPVVTMYIDDRVTEEVNSQIATTTNLGLVKASSDVEVAADGTMSVPELNTITNNMTTLDNRYNTRIGALDNLVTGNKTNLVAAINETFQFGSEKKAKLVENLTAKGINCSTNDSWETLLGYILTIDQIHKGG